MPRKKTKKIRSSRDPRPGLASSRSLIESDQPGAARNESETRTRISRRPNLLGLLMALLRGGIVAQDARIRSLQLFETGIQRAYSSLTCFPSAEVGHFRGSI